MKKARDQGRLLGTEAGNAVVHTKRSVKCGAEALSAVASGNRRSTCRKVPWPADQCRASTPEAGRSSCASGPAVRRLCHSLLGLVSDLFSPAARPGTTQFQFADT
jgi:hypothetical protein